MNFVLPLFRFKIKRILRPCSLQYVWSTDYSKKNLHLVIGHGGVTVNADIKKKKNMGLYIFSSRGSGYGELVLFVLKGRFCRKIQQPCLRSKGPFNLNKPGLESRKD